VSEHAEDLNTDTQTFVVNITYHLYNNDVNKYFQVLHKQKNNQPIAWEQVIGKLNKNTQ